MSDDALLSLALEAGISAQWRDAFGKVQRVEPDTLRAVLMALELPAGSDAEIADSRRKIVEQNTGAALPPLFTALAGQPTPLPLPPGRFRLTREDGGVAEGDAAAAEAGCTLPPIAEIGYHRLELGDAALTLAVSPGRCVGIAERVGRARAWGIAVQLYGLRRAGDAGIGDFAALADFVGAAARHGAEAVAISPVHAQFSADVNRFSPYAPSSRVMLNVLHTPLPGDGGDTGRALEGLDLIDWPEAARYRLSRLRAAYDQGRDRAALDAFRRERGEALESHARFEALHARLFGEDAGRWHWRNWPDAFRDPRHRAVEQFAQENQAEVGFHAWLQMQAEQHLAAAQQAARDAGMRIGLVADLAVGTDSGGSHAWSRQDEMLIGLTVGAPPDLLSPGGQNWGLVAFSSIGLRQHGYAAYIEMLRAALRHAGGVRIDHALGLNRLWVVPDGAGADHGAYLNFPEQDMLRLVALESVRHQAIVLGEDLGTVPEGFSDRLRDAGVLGMRVLWFERDAQRFLPPAEWTASAVAMTSTHDLSTVAGWWRGRDLDLRAGLSMMRDEADERHGRDADRGLLWQAMQDSGAATGPMPPLEQPDAFVDAALRHVGRSACDLAMIPIEDVLGLPEQPNLPGTLDEHPNWRRRLAVDAASVLDEPACQARLATLNEERR